MKKITVNFICLLLSALVMQSGNALGQLAATERQFLKDKVGKWSVVMTMQPEAKSPAQIIKGISAERTMVGDYCIHEIMHPDQGINMPDFIRLADLAWNVNEQRWDYISIDSRITAGIMYYTYKISQNNSITSFISSYPNPGFGPGKKDRGQALYTRNVILKINNDHEVVKQYWKLTDQAEWLAVQYDYIRITTR